MRNLLTNVYPWQLTQFGSALAHCYQETQFMLHIIARV